MELIAARVASGETVRFRPAGNSMTPRIRSRQLVTVEPVKAAALKVGDVALGRVRGTIRLHLVSAVDHGNRRVQISNNHGHVNGWTSHDRVYGICVAVED